MGKPQRKTHRSRKSVTIHPDSRMGPKGCPPPRGQPQITGYKHLYLANLFSHASKPDKKDRILRVRVHGSTRRLVKALQNHPDAKIEVSRVLFLGICLDFHYFLGWVGFPKL